MLDNPDIDRDRAIENVAMPTQSRKSNDNIYDFHQTSIARALKSESASNRSPSSLANTQTTKYGSQSSIRSASSGKEPNIMSNLEGGRKNGLNQIQKYSERREDSEASHNEHQFEDNKSLLVKAKSKDTLERRTPVPAHRRNLSKTHLIDGIPQTEV